jgi:hypothetical protein
MKNKWQFKIFLAAIILIIFISGCELPQPTCDSTSLLQPVLMTPTNREIVSGTSVTLDWEYPDASCAPDGYRVFLHTGPYYNDDLVEETVGDQWIASGLETATTYSWGVQVRVGSTYGPIAGSNYFTIGPICDTASLIAPTLLEPVDGGVVTETAPSLIWEYMDTCVPMGYRIDLSLDPAFADTSLSGGTGSPDTRWGPGSDLVSCRTYYWRVAPINDTTLGPFSGSRSFSVNVGGVCDWVATWGSISGLVWHDLCAIPEMGPIPDPPPMGCIVDGGEIIGDGIFQAGEPGISGVGVRLGVGNCPATGYLDAVTGADGTFHFVIPPPTEGTYCISIDAIAPPSDSALIPGGWSFPNGLDGSLANWEVTLGEGEHLEDINFGWDYQFLPGYGQFGWVSGTVWHDVCAVPPSMSPPPSPLPVGCIQDASGVVHADGIRQPSEPPISGIKVDIGTGDCPTVGGISTFTNADGTYTFSVTSPGDYCIRINAEDNPNDSILIPGYWTMVSSGHMGMTFRAISLGVGELLNDQDFGWDYDELPAYVPLPVIPSYIPPVVVPSPTPTLVPVVCSNFTDQVACQNQSTCLWVVNPKILTHKAYHCISK